MILKISIFDLIKSLSGSEKRYIKLATEFKEDNNHSRLFNCYDRMRSYNDTLILKEFKGEAILNQIHVAENYLYKTLLKCLRNFHAESNPDLELRNQLSDVALLYEKGLYSQCRNVLNHLEKTALKLEHHLILLEIYKWYGELRQKVDKAKVIPDHLRVFQNELNSLSALRNTIDYQKIAGDLMPLKTETAISSISLREMEKTMLSAQLQSEAKAFTFESKLLFYQLHASYHQLKGDSRELEFRKKMLSLLESQPAQVQKNPLLFLKSAESLVAAQIKAGAHDDAERTLRKLKTATQDFRLKNSLRWQATLFSLTHSLELTNYEASGESAKGIALIPQLTAELERLKKHIAPEQMLRFFFAFARLHFSAGKHKDALRWINMLIRDPNKEILPEVQSAARMMQLILHYETKDWETLSYSVINTARYLKAIHKASGAETVLLTTMRKLDDLENAKELKLFIKLKTNLEELSGNENENKLSEIFNVLKWVESKIKMLQQEQNPLKHS